MPTGPFNGLGSVETTPWLPKQLPENWGHVEIRINITHYFPTKSQLDGPPIPKSSN